MVCYLRLKNGCNKQKNELHSTWARSINIEAIGRSDWATTLRVMPDPWRLDSLCRRWKWNTPLILKQRWFEAVDDTAMHDWAVSIALHMHFQALAGFTPSHSGNLLAGQSPITKASESMHELDSCTT